MTNRSEWSVLLHAWAEEVQRLIREFYVVRNEHFRLLVAQERDEDLSPSDDDVVRAFRRHWIASQKVVWAAYQFNRWRVRHAASRQQEVPAIDANLKNLRDALEHLDEAVWLDDFTLGPPSGDGRSRNAGRAMQKLPSESLMFGLGFDEKIMDLVDVEALSKETDEAIAALEQEQYEAWTEEAEYLAEQGYWEEWDQP